MTQTVSTMSKSLADENRSRDVRRRIEVIHKKLADLQELGIPCAFCYSSARNTGSIFTLGDSRITDVIERHKNEILVHLTGDNSEQTEGNSSKEIHLILPPLPSPLEELSRQTLQSLIVGIIKDLGLKWTDLTPSWWPTDIPFVHPRSLPQTYYGNLVQALRKILESVYGYFNYDITKYTASQLEHESGSPTATGEVARIQPQAQLDPDSDREGEISTTPNATTNTPESRVTLEKKPPTKAISNFTVENILMGPQYSSSSSSHSPSSTSTGSSQTSPVEYSSILPGNWISHPPVKYTKYTMLSPGSMVEDKAKKKSKTETILGVNPRPRHHSSSMEASPSLNDSHKLTVRRVPSNPITRVPSGEQLHHTTSHSGSNGHQVTRLASTEDSKPLLSTSLSPSHAMISRSISTLPVIQAIPYSSPGGKAVLQQTFPPSQQFVLLVPSTSANVGEGLQAVMYTNQTQAQYSQSTTKPSTARPSEHLSEAVSPSNETDQRMLELAYRPIAPKNKTIFKDMTPISTLTTTPTIDKKGYKRSPAVTKPQKLRFHMTTVVKRPKHSSVMTSSMTVESPSTIVSERTKTTSFILDSQPSAEAQAEKHITKTKNSYLTEKLTEDPERVETSPRSIASNDDLASHSDEASVDHHTVSRHSSLKEALETKKDKLTFINCHEDKQFETSNDVGRTTRSYTRRKRELTFHLYEDPETAFKTKRSCKE